MRGRMRACEVNTRGGDRQSDWFAPSVTDNRMLRIEENNDLMPAVELVLKMK